MAGKAKKRAGVADREVLYGFHPVMEALTAGRRRFYNLLVGRSPVSERNNQVTRLAEKNGIAWQTQPSAQLRAICGSDQHQGVVATVSPLPMDVLESLVFECCGERGQCLLVLLDSIVDPNNLGAITRTAHCVGADAIIVPKDRAAGATPAVSKASAGAMEHTRLCRVTNLVTTIKWLKKQGVWVAGMAMQADRSVFQADFNGPLALVVGGEEKGLRPLVRQHCDYLVSIPMNGRIDSLNASAAAAVVLYEAFRQRQPVNS